MNKKDSIILAALELLVSNGIHATPMSAIAKHAKTGMGTIYNYFPNKEVLVNCIYIYIKEKEEQIVLNQITEGPIKKQFESHYLGVIKFYAENPVFFDFMHQFQASPIITDESKEQAYQVIEPVISLIRQGQEEGIIKNIDPYIILSFLAGSILHFLSKHLRDSSIFDNKLIDTHLLLVWDAIKM